jgi:hypothetical protein
MLGVLVTSHLPQPSSVSTLWIIRLKFKNPDSQALVIKNVTGKK